MTKHTTSSHTLLILIRIVCITASDNLYKFLKPEHNMLYVCVSLKRHQNQIPAEVSNLPRGANKNFSKQNPTTVPPKLTLSYSRSSADVVNFMSEESYFNQNMLYLCTERKNQVEWLIFKWSISHKHKQLRGKFKNTVPPKFNKATLFSSFPFILKRK